MKRAFSEFDALLVTYQFAHAWSSRLLYALWCTALGSIAVSCGSPPSSVETAREVAQAPLPEYKVMFFIHGDGGYLFHDGEGKKYRADEEALAGAKRVAQRNTKAEVFIFHEKRRRHVLFIFPRHDGEFYYYRNGQLLAQESYWRDQGESRFDPEIALYNRFRGAEQDQAKRLFLYFGHEIPEFDGTGYDASHRKRAFTVRDLGDGLKRIAGNFTKFDLVVLSTCFNGTPYTISNLSPYARYIIASPGNLHLSYLDLRPFETLDSGLSDGDVAKFAKGCAQLSFDRLTKDIQTEISVAVYDVDRVQEYLSSVDSVYKSALVTLEKRDPISVEHCDCADDSTFTRPAMSEGVAVYYRAARFGRSAHKQLHSGWECPKLPD